MARTDFLHLQKDSAANGRVDDVLGQLASGTSRSHPGRLVGVSFARRPACRASQ
jgi:hypothetical protein